jgi:glycosidase
MPKWNTENPGTRKHLIDAAVYWIREYDIDGWRLDVSDEVSLDFWREFSRTVREAKTDCYIAGEMWHDVSNWPNPGYFSAAMKYPLGFAAADFFLRKSINPRDALQGRKRRLPLDYQQRRRRIAGGLHWGKTHKDRRRNRGMRIKRVARSQRRNTSFYPGGFSY